VRHHRDRGRAGRQGGVDPAHQRAVPRDRLVGARRRQPAHRAPSTDARTRLQAYIGTLVSDEYDLEGTAAQVPEFQDLFLNLN
jgi:hypothetical protein